jgi:hypothetical protein
MPEVMSTSPDCTPWVKTGRDWARLIAGMASEAAKAVPPARTARREGRISLFMKVVPVAGPRAGSSEQGRFNSGFVKW